MFYAISNIKLINPKLTNISTIKVKNMNKNQVLIKYFFEGVISYK